MSNTALNGPEGPYLSLQLQNQIKEKNEMSLKDKNSETILL